MRMVNRESLTSELFMSIVNNEPLTSIVSRKLSSSRAVQMLAKFG